MEIFINEEKVDYSLEQEKNLGQLIDHFQKWALEKNHFIEQILINQKEMGLEQALNSPSSLKQVQRIDFFIKNRTSQIEEMIDSILHYLDQFIKIAQENNKEFLINKCEKIEGLAWLTDSVSLVSQNLGVETAYIFYHGHNLEETLNFFRISIDQLSRFVHDSQFFSRYIQEGVLPKLILLKNLFHSLLDYYNYLLDPKNSSFKENFLKEKEFIQKLLEAIPLSLQDGKDQEALSFIQKSFAFFYSFILLLSKTPLSSKSQDHFSHIQADLKENLELVYESFKEKDIVTVSDIVEYELIEKLEGLSLILKES